MINKIKKLSSVYHNDIIDIRRHLHKYPELSFHENKTSIFIQKILYNWNIPFEKDIAENGIVVTLSGSSRSNNNVIGLRADIDALPIEEKNITSYKSKNKGVMHACGHDAHTASLLGTIRILNELKGYYGGTVKFIFQPAEEMLPGGAKQMIEQGVLENPSVQNMIAQHVFPDLEVGKVGFCSGKYMASTDELHITVNSTGGHAALIDNKNNPIFIATKLINKLADYFEQKHSGDCLFSIGYFEAKGSTNVVPATVKLKGTFRSLDEDLREKSHSKMLKISNSLIKGKTCIDFNIIKGYPCLINDPFLTKKNISFAEKYLGKNNVVDLPIRMTAEDFSYFTQLVPSCFYRLGTANKKRNILSGLHTSTFDIDEESLKIGMGLMAFLAVKNIS